MYEQEYDPECEDTTTACMGIYLIKAHGRFTTSEPSATIIAHDESEAMHISFSEGISGISEIKLIGYALPKYVTPEVLYINLGEYIHENINN
jgi:hypothetical protein